MTQKGNIKPTVGIVLSTVPGYSETFFRNKIKGLQENGFKVLLFVDYIKPEDSTFPCEVIAGINLNKNSFKKYMSLVSVFFKLIFFHPFRSLKLYTLDKRDGVSFRERIKMLVLNQFLLSKKIDWLHFGFGMLAHNRENVAEAINAKMAVSFRGYDLYLSPLKHPNCYDRLFTKNVQYHVLSNEMKDTLLDYNIEKSRIHVITPAIDINLFKFQNQPVENNILALTTIARLHWKKGIEYTLEALSILKKEGIVFEYKIIGSGEQKERLVFAAHQLGVLDHVTFLGKLPQQEVKKHLETTNIYIQYSIQEGFCNAVLEAQAMGVLCVVSNAEGLQENILHEKTGWVVPKRQPELLAQRIKKLINLSSDEQQKIKEFAISRVQKEFNLDAQNLAFVNFYNL